MAKRRKEKDEGEDKPFKIPKFDEEAFLKRERRNIKTTFISFLFGSLMALVCFGFWVLMGKNDLRWELVLLVGVINAAFLKYIFLRLNIDFSDFGRKNWFGSYAIYFFTWLIAFIVIVNPPFYDDETPRVEVAVLPGMQELGGNVIIVAKITDNADVDKSSITLDINDPEGNSTTLSPSFDGTISSFTFENTGNILGEFSYTLTAKDTNGQATKKTGSFSYDTDIIEITSSRFENITSGDDITIEANEEISAKNFRLYYRLNDGDEINVNRKYLEIRAEYETSPEYEGWAENSNYNMTLYAEVSHYFTNINKKYNNTVMEATIYEFSTSTASKIGSETPPMPWNWSKPKDKQAPVLLNYDHYDIDGDQNPNNDILLPHPRAVFAPGFEVLVFLISLVVVVLIFKKRKKNRRKQK